MSDSNWIDLVAVSDLEPGDVTPAQHKGQPLAVYDGPDGIHVTSARCSHGGASLVDGYFDGFIIECPLHQGCFDIRDGRACGKPATRAIKVFECRTLEGMVQIKG
mgnify:FL=1